MNVDNKDSGSLSFEDALAKLEDVVSKMESGRLPLDQMISYFEEGNRLSKYCQKRLSELEKKIEVLVKEDDEGGEWQEFSESSAREVQVAEAPQLEKTASDETPDLPF